MIGYTDIRSFPFIAIVIVTLSSCVLYFSDFVFVFIIIIIITITIIIIIIIYLFIHLFIHLFRSSKLKYKLTTYIRQWAGTARLDNQH